MTSHEIQATIFEQLSDNVKECLLSNARARTFERGTTISLHGEPTKTLKVVQSGWVKLYRVSQSGDEAVIAAIREGQSFDEIASIQRRPSAVSAQAVDDCTILFIDPSSAFSCNNAHQELMNAVLGAAWNHIETFLDDIEELKVKTGVQRLTNYLLGLTGSEHGQKQIFLPFDKTLLAGKLGMKPESLSRAFGRLRPMGVRSYRRNVTIQSVSELRSYSEQLKHGAV